jgi:hypothetical protein
LRLPHLAAYLYGGKVVLLLALSTTGYALSKLVAGTRAGCVCGQRVRPWLSSGVRCASVLPPPLRTLTRRVATCRPAVTWTYCCGALIWAQVRAHQRKR